jgi:FdrA protein
LSATSYSVRRHTYLDSVFLMRLAKSLESRAGVLNVAALMATPANKQMLRDAGFTGVEVDSAAPDDLIVGVAAGSAEEAQAAISDIDGLLSAEAPVESTQHVQSWDQAVAALPHANLAVISLPGEFATAEVEQALDRGLHVFCFSSNVPLEDEIRLKRLAHARGLLLMGPDCGTAIIAGRGIGFSNAVRRGRIGIVGGSGTGIQAVSCLLHVAGSGVSHALGTGSRDASDEVGGITTIDALQALIDDPESHVIVLVSKLPSAGTRAKVASAIAVSPKPVVTCYLGAASAGSATTLDDAAAQALRLAGEAAALPNRSGAPAAVAHIKGRALGLFAGGSLLLEARGVLERAAVAISRYELLDMGSEELTRGRPHPMIDSRLRAERIVKAGDDVSVGAILLDVVLGRGAAADPAGDLAPAIREARARAAQQGRHLMVVAAVCGTEDDPQVRSRQEDELRGAGVTLLATNASATAFVAGAFR